MKKIALLAITLALLTSCAGRFKDPRKYHGVDPAFTSYYQMYEDWYGVVIYDVPIHFDEISQAYAGICKAWTGGYYEIFINKSHWDYFSEKERISLVFHELGHCEQQRQHTFGRLTDGCPNSIMDEYMINLQCLNAHWDYYLEELNPN